MSGVPLSVRIHWLGAGVVLGGVLFQTFWLGLPAILVGVGLVFTYGLWTGGARRVAPRRKVVSCIGVLVFLVHAAEEFLTELQRDLPALVGRTRWSDEQFLVFTGAWAVAFCTAAARVRVGRPLPVLIILFFALGGGLANGVLHLLLVLQRGAHFPGAWTGPLCLVMGIWLLRLLYASEPSGSGRASR